MLVPALELQLEQLWALQDRTESHMHGTEQLKDSKES